MSTEDRDPAADEQTESASREAPRTRAEARALRAEAEAEAEASRGRGGGAGDEQAEPPAADLGEASAAEPPTREEDSGAQAVPGLPEMTVPVAPRRAADLFVAAEPEPVLASEGSSAGITAPGGADRSAPGGQAEDRGPGLHGARRRFGALLAGALGVLMVAGAALATLALMQGPRVSDVQADPRGAIEASGSRVILTANQALSPIDESQVSVEPEAPFTVDAAGRGVGVRFTVPLDDDTTYTVTVRGVTAVGGGPAADLTTSFTTPAAEIHLLQRDPDGDDKIFLTDLSGEQAHPVFEHEAIDDFRATATSLVVSVEENGVSSLLVMGRDGSDPRELPLPGRGFIGDLQVSDRGGLVGYTYTDEKITATSGRASILFTQELRGDAEPREVVVPGDEVSVGEWFFVRDTAAVLYLDFRGALYVEDRSGDAGPTALGNARSIQGVSRGTYTAVVDRAEGLVEVDLASGAEEPLLSSTPDYGTLNRITPFPGGTLRHVTARDAAGFPTGQAVIRVDENGAAVPVISVAAGDAIVQACPSPSGEYTAVVIAPDLVNNPYDGALLPLPERLETRILDTETGEQIVPLSGFDPSWCALPPSP